jgi:hypothetical protein
LESFEMRVLFLLAVVFVCSGPACIARDSITNPLVGRWKLDAEATASYLREHKILPEAALQRLFASPHSVGWRFDEKRIYGSAHEEGNSMPYRIVAQSGLKLVLVTVDESTGKKFTATIIMDEDGKGYWQETSGIKGYRERVIRER